MESNVEITMKDYSIYSPYSGGLAIKSEDQREIFYRLLESLPPEIQENIKSEATAWTMKNICESFGLDVADSLDVVSMTRDIATGAKPPEILRELPEKIFLDGDRIPQLISRLVNEVLIPIKTPSRQTETKVEEPLQDFGRVINLRKTDEI